MCSNKSISEIETILHLKSSDHLTEQDINRYFREVPDEEKKYLFAELRCTEFELAFYKKQIKTYYDNEQPGDPMWETIRLDLKSEKTESIEENLDSLRQEVRRRRRWKYALLKVIKNYSKNPFY